MGAFSGDGPLANEAQGGLAVKIVVGITSVIGLGIFAYKQAGPAFADVDADHPGPLIAIGVVVIALGGLAAWRWTSHRRGLSARIRRKD